MPTNQELACRLLIQRAKGYSIAHVLRQSKRRYLIHIALLVGFVVELVITDKPVFKGLSLWAIGMFSGALLRDIGWFRRIKQIWPFTEKITDWQKVEAMAEGTNSVNE